MGELGGFGIGVVVDDAVERRAGALAIVEFDLAGGDVEQRLGDARRVGEAFDEGLLRADRRREILDRVEGAAWPRWCRYRG